MPSKAAAVRFFRQLPASRRRRKNVHELERWSSALGGTSVSTWIGYRELLSPSILENEIEYDFFGSSMTAAIRSLPDRPPRLMVTPWVRRDPIHRIDHAIGGSTTQRVIQQHFAVFSSRASCPPWPPPSLKPGRTSWRRRTHQNRSTQNATSPANKRHPRSISTNPALILSPERESGRSNFPFVTGTIVASSIPNGT
jgi:hypothetical protein